MYILLENLMARLSCNPSASSDQISNKSLPPPVDKNNNAHQIVHKIFPRTIAKEETSGVQVMVNAKIPTETVMMVQVAAVSIH